MNKNSSTKSTNEKNTPTATFKNSTATPWEKATVVLLNGELWEYAPPAMALEEAIR